MPIIQAPEMREPLNQRKGEDGFHIKQPHRLFDHIKEFYKIDSDSALAHMIGILPPEMSRIRNGHTRISAKVILGVYDATKMPIEKIREMLK